MDVYPLTAATTATAAHEGPIGRTSTTDHGEAGATDLRLSFLTPADGKLPVARATG